MNAAAGSATSDFNKLIANNATDDFNKSIFIYSCIFQNAPEKSFVARRQGVEERSVHAVHEYRRTPQPTTPQAILTSILLIEQIDSHKTRHNACHL